MDVRQDIPYSEEAEVSVLGAIVIDSEAANTVMESVGPSYFFKNNTRTVFRAMQALYEQGKEIDATTLLDYLRSEGNLDAAGGPSAISELIEAVPTAANVEHHVDILREKKRLRDVVRVGKQMIKDARNAGSGEVEDVISRAESNIFRITDETLQEGPFKAVEFMEEVGDDLRARIDREQNVGIPSGFQDLDSKIVGMEPGEYILIAGRPSMGKTALALNIMEHISVSQPEPEVSVMFSLEMEKKRLMYRLISSYGSVDSMNLKTGALSDDDFDSVKRAMQDIADAPVFIDDSGTLTPMQIRAKLRRIASEYDLGAVFVDYLQLMDTGGNQDNRQHEVSRISRDLKAIAKEFDVPMVALSQLNRRVEERSNKRPRMSDLRESGALEQDADVILFLYRPEYYNEDDDATGNGMTEVIIGKQRNGPTGTVKLRFEEEYTRFRDLTQQGL